MLILAYRTPPVCGKGSARLIVFYCDKCRKPSFRPLMQTTGLDERR
jgi:hypothetical protein